MIILVITLAGFAPVVVPPAPSTSSSGMVYAREPTTTPTKAPTAEPDDETPNDTDESLDETDNATAPTINRSVLFFIEQVIQDVYKRVNPSVVNIQVTRKVSANTDDLFPDMPDSPDIPDFHFFEPPDEDYYTQGAGSGFVWDSEGHIVTNNHVVSDADRVSVTFADGTTVEGVVIGTDPHSDLAVVKVDVEDDMLYPIELMDSNEVKAGQLSIAIGNPFGLEGTMTVGFISAVGRSLPVASETGDGSTYSIPDIIQTDASINPGNSGGVLVNDRGQLIGVPAAIQSPVRASAGVGFAIPSAIVAQVVPVLIEEGSYEHPWIGISGTTLTSDMAEKMGLDPLQRGALVIEVSSDSPADDAGLQGSGEQATINGQKRLIGGDVIISFDDRPVTKFDDLVAYLARYTRVGQTVSLTVLRDGEEETLDLTLGKRPSSPAEEQKTTSAPEPTVWLGIEGQELTAEIAEEMELDSTQQGVLIAQVAGDSPADDAGLRGSYKSARIGGERILIGGDVITAVEGETVANLDDIQQAISDAEPGDVVTLTILRDGDEQEVEVTLAERP
jgi:S1-C subfamily serine protease